MIFLKRIFIKQLKLYNNFICRNVNLYELQFVISVYNLQLTADVALLRYIIISGTAVAQWLRCCATNRKVTGSIPDGVGIFH